MSAAFGIRRGEAGLAWCFFCYFLVLVASHYAAKSVRQATYIDALGADNLPWVYLAVAVISFPVLVLYTRLSEHRPHHVLIIASCIAQYLGLTLFFFLYAFDQAWVAVAFYVWTTVAFGLGVSQFWSYAHLVFDARQARRLFAFIGAGGLLGGVPGGQMARVMTAHLGTRYTLLGAAVLMLLAIVFIFAIESRRPPGDSISGRPNPFRELDEAKIGLRTLRGSRLLLLIAALMGITVVVAQMVDLQFYWAVERHTTDLDQRTVLVGTFFSVLGLLAFLFQIVFTRRIHRGWGVEAGTRILPGSLAVSLVLLILAMGVLPSLVFAVAWVLKLSEGGFRHSIDQASRELLFMPVAEQVRARAKAFIDVFVQRSAEGVAALLLLPLTFGLMSIYQLSWLTLLLVVAWLALTVLVQREYVTAFRSGLISGVLQEPPSIDPADLTTVTTLVQSLGSSETRQVLHSLQLLAAHGHGALVPPLLLHHADPEVRRKTLEVLAAAKRQDATPLVERAVSDVDPAVRSGAMQTLSVLQGERASGLMIPRLADPDHRVRAAAAANLIGGSHSEASAQANSVLMKMMADEDPEIRAEVARAMAAVKEPIACATVVQLLYDRDVSVVREAVRTVRERVSRDGQNPIYLPILISLMGNRRLKQNAREALVACGESAIASCALFMKSPDEQIWVRRAVPKTVALTGTQQATDVLLSSLDEGDSMLRAKIIEALAYMRSRNDDLDMPVRAVRRHLRVERDRYLEALRDLWMVAGSPAPTLNGPLAVLGGDGEPVSLIEQMLALRMRRSLDCLFGLLSLIYPLSDVQAAHRSLLSPSSKLRARALEYLDNTLKGALKREVFAVIDDVPAESKLLRTPRAPSSNLPPREATLARLMSVDLERDPAADALAIAAAHAVYSEALQSLYPVVSGLAREARDARLRETARWVEARVTAGANGPGDGGQGVGMMSDMAHIEMVVFLQRVDLFSFCTAEQVVQLASIASERHCGPAEVIFRREDAPDTMYCVVEGTVRLVEPGREDTIIDTSGRFGVIDILSGRRRTYDAVAEKSGARLLTIAADDFFDLLSNNIEIVKALFRQIL